MIGPVHYEFHIFSNRAKLADYELVANERKVIKNVFFEIFDPFRVVIVSVVSDDNMGGDVIKFLRKPT